MGEYADDFNLAGIDEWHGAEVPSSGPSAQYWPGDYPPQYILKTKTCKYCGTAPLYWQQVEGKWRLHSYKDGRYELHCC